MVAAGYPKPLSLPHRLAILRQHALQPRREAVVFPVAPLGRTAAAEQEEVLALDVCQHQGADDPIEHVRRGRPAVPLLKPSVPGRADIGALRNFFPAQAEGAAAL